MTEKVEDLWRCWLHSDFFLTISFNKKVEMDVRMQEIRWILEVDVIPVNYHFKKFTQKKQKQ